MLEKVNSPRDIKGFNVKDLENLAAEVRDKLIETVSKNLPVKSLCVYA